MPIRFIVDAFPNGNVLAIVDRVDRVGNSRPGDAPASGRYCRFRIRYPLYQARVQRVDLRRRPLFMATENRTSFEQKELRLGGPK